MKPDNSQEQSSVPEAKTEEPGTSLYRDIHEKVDGLTAEAVAEAHRRDIEVEGKYGVNILKYWYDEGSGKVFCLAHAPSKEAFMAVHREAHGLVADKIIEVKEGS